MYSRWNSIGTQFGNVTTINKFNELRYFTGITSLVSYAFQGSSIKELTVPANVTSIGSQGLRANYLTKVTMLGTTPPTTNANNFSTTRYYYVPASALDTYKSANIWSSYANNILPITE